MRLSRQQAYRNLSLAIGFLISFHAVLANFQQVSHTVGMHNISNTAGMTGFSRRQFISTTTAATAALLSQPLLVPAQIAAPIKWPIAVFSKAFQELGFDATADLVAEVGWDGIECPVRKAGHIKSAQVEEDLPKMMEALKKRGKSVMIITTEVVNATDPVNVKVLRCASKLGLKTYRLGAPRYDLNKPILPQLNEFKAAFKDIAALNKELGLYGGFQNHSGANYFGAPIWDVMECIRDLDPQHIGMFFDIAHATVEGGLSWPCHAKLVEERMGAVFAKDCNWQKGPKGLAAKWCPLGEGIVNKTFFDRLKKSKFNGLISQHFEYEIAAGEDKKSIYKKDLATLKSWLS